MTTAEHDPALVETLNAFVPWQMLEYQRLTPDQRCLVAQRAASVIGAKGDVLQFGGKHAGTAATALIRGLAAAAFQPGGCTFAGLHWCAAPHDGCPREVAG